MRMMIFAFLSVFGVTAVSAQYYRIKLQCNNKDGKTAVFFATDTVYRSQAECDTNRSRLRADAVQMTGLNARCARHYGYPASSWPESGQKTILACSVTD